MFRGCIPILMVAAALAQAQRDSVRQQPVGGVSIPAELTTTIRAENAQRGDSVEFRTLEAVLIKDGLVMPAHAKLMGRVVGAASRHGDKPSWLVLLVERAEWKNQRIPLHAFISAQVVISRVDNQALNSPNGMTNSTNPPNPRRVGHESGRVAALNGVDVLSSAKLPQDASTTSPPIFAANSVPLKDLRIVHDKDGIVYLFSNQSNVKLPNGTMFMLQNEPAIVTDKAGADVSPQVPPNPT